MDDVGLLYEHGQGVPQDYFAGVILVPQVGRRRTRSRNGLTSAIYTKMDLVFYKITRKP